MFKFGIRNLRRLNCVDAIEIRPLTILLGRNSSGKSSFLRLFPLIRQSIATRISSPILWYGDFVDYGSFEGAVSRNDVSKSIEFLFGIDDLWIDARSDPVYWNQTRRRSMNKGGGASVCISISKSGERTRIDSFSIDHYGDDLNRYNVELSESGVVSKITVNGEDVSYLLEGIAPKIQQGTIFPDSFFWGAPADASLVRFLTRNTWSHFVKHMHPILKKHLDKRIGDEQIDSLSYNILMLESFTSKSIEAIIGQVSVKSMQKLLSDIAGKDSHGIRKQIEHIYRAHMLFAVSSSAFRYLNNKMSGVLYIGPMRARSERYYRYQDLAVSEIDADGKNFPMFLNSLSASQIKEFSSWVNSRFGFGVSISRKTGHISINLVAGDVETNIVDNGYGISQILPVLGQVWWAQSRLKRSRGIQASKPKTIIAIEQPELHLHPAHQALLADALVGEKRGVTRDSDDLTPELNFIVETHSEAFVNRVGQLVANGMLNPGDVQIAVFEQDPNDDRNTIVRQSNFERDGALTNWPYGFFEPGL